MAQSYARLPELLRETASRLSESGTTYRWSSFGHCNCGHLAQTVTGLRAAELQRRAMQCEGDWASQARDAERDRRPVFEMGDRPAPDEGAWEPEDVGACSVTGKPMDEVLAQIHQMGLSAADIANLERLSDPEVRRRLGNNTDDFSHYIRENVVRYLHAWADLLEERSSGFDEQDGEGGGPMKPQHLEAAE